MRVVRVIGDWARGMMYFFFWLRMRDGVWVECFA